ncbi:hypothetical protein NQ317_015873 [Molorchus minor]|uniref:Uncharacterized protein n=1 Tax=Molorchus minor TaxID=1323400 RepID=A0ABQ9J1H9_9CUCU|nr:hypothetical protein NQ317_015873 [Molorchus minor]
MKSDRVGKLVERWLLKEMSLLKKLTVNNMTTCFLLGTVSYLYDKMEIWIFLVATLYTLKAATNLQIAEHCGFHQSILKGRQLTCTNITQEYFQKLNVHLNQTHWLRCDNCNLTVLSETLFNMPPRNNISVLDLSNSRAQIVRKFAFGKFPLLKYLSVRNNSIESIDVMAFSGIKKLIQLDLSINNIRVLTNNMFSELENLDILSLNKNQIFHTQPEAFAVQYNFKPLTNLLDLQIRFNNLREIQTSSFNGLKNIKSLHLGDNHIHFVSPYGHMTNLKFLWLRDNDINNFTLDYKYEVQNSLVVLDLSNNNLTRFNFESLYDNIPNIKEIFLVCISDNCSFNATRNYMENICKNWVGTEVTFEDTSTDFTVDSFSKSVYSTVLMLNALLLIFVTFFNLLNL